MSEEMIQTAQVAGSFYPSDKTELQAIINTCLKKANVPAQSDDDILGIVVPHAGYVYSAQTAAFAYKSIQGKKYDVAIILAPSHHAYFHGASVFSGDKFRTPLGDIEVDKAFAIQLTRNGRNKVVRSEIGFTVTDDKQPEHAAEVQLPFLQTVQPDLPIVPIIIGSDDAETIFALSHSIVETAKETGKRILIVASSDLSHYHSASDAEIRDSRFISYFSKFDYFGMEIGILTKSCEACGYVPAIIMMQTAEALGANKSIPLQYSNSSTSIFVKSDSSRVVGYFSGLIAKSAKSGFPLLPDFSDSEKSYILSLAKTSVEDEVRKTKSEFNLSTDPKFAETICPAFVTLNKNNQLRGCIWHIIGSVNLNSEIATSATMAASKDNRFLPVDTSELSSLEYEVTILSRMKFIQDISEIEIGKHGVYLKYGSWKASAIFLPQVAPENNWNTTQLLENLSLKAGLSKDAYKESLSQIYVFEATIIK